jgi:hypothetical protein
MGWRIKERGGGYEFMNICYIITTFVNATMYSNPAQQ